MLTLATMKCLRCRVCLAVGRARHTACCGKLAKWAAGQRGARVRRIAQTVLASPMACTYRQEPALFSIRTMITAELLQ